MIAANYAPWTYNALVILGIIACVLAFIWEGRRDEGMRSPEEARRDWERALKYEWREPTDG